MRSSESLGRALFTRLCSKEGCYTTCWFGAREFTKRIVASLDVWKLPRELLALKGIVKASFRKSLGAFFATGAFHYALLCKRVRECRNRIVGDLFLQASYRFAYLFCRFKSLLGVPSVSRVSVMPCVMICRQIRVSDYISVSNLT